VREHEKSYERLQREREEKFKKKHEERLKAISYDAS